MTSRRQIEANRANAAKSTGSQTSAGKATSSRNACRHGLSCRDEAAGSGSVGFDAILAEELNGAGMEVALQDLAQARRRQDCLRVLRLQLILAVIERTERRGLIESGAVRVGRPVSRRGAGLKRVKRNNG